MSILLREDPYPSDAEMDELWRLAWGGPPAVAFSRILGRSLAHVGAYEWGRLAGFANVAWDGGIHAFIVDVCVIPDRRRQGVGKSLVREAARLAGERGAHWLHVDFEPHLEDFYASCGFAPTKAGLMELRFPPG